MNSREIFNNDDSGVHSDRSRTTFMNTNTFETSDPSATEKAFTVSYQESPTAASRDEGKASEEVSRFQGKFTPTIGGNVHNDYRQATPTSQLFYLRRSNRGSSTPKRVLTLCPFATPDRLNESVIHPGIFEFNPRGNKDTFSPCIDWVSTMQPVWIDASDPAAYLPPQRTASVEQKAQKEISEYFEEKKVVPSPEFTATGGRLRRSVSFEETKENVTLNSKRVSRSLINQKLRTYTNCGTQTRVTIPPDVDIDELFAPFATYVETEVRESFMDASFLSESPNSSSQSICSLSRRKLFSEENEASEKDEDIFGCFAENKSHQNEEHTKENDQNSANSPSDNVAILEAFSFEPDQVESSRINSEDNSYFGDEDEIPREDLNIDLSPIKPMCSLAQQKTRPADNDTPRGNNVRIGNSHNVSMASIPVTPTRPSRRRFVLYEGFSVSMEIQDCSISRIESGVNDVTSMEMSVL